MRSIFIFQFIDMEIINEPNEYYAEEYAGFLLRLVAYIIDSIILSVVFFVIIAIFFGSAFLGMGTDPSETQLALFFISYLIAILGLIVAQWIYFAMMESSKYQATIGKMAVGIIVTDMAGDPISFGRASGRYFAKILSGMIMMIGYLMAAFTERQQALHDIIAATLVMKKVRAVN
jgi:uncharacterized RDD family membrane protein YckC